MPPHSDRPQRPVVVIAALGLVVVGAATVAALAYDVIIRGSDTAGLVSIASIAIGSLATLAGTSAHKRQSGPDDLSEK